MASASKAKGQADFLLGLLIVGTFLTGMLRSRVFWVQATEWNMALEGLKRFAKGKHGLSNLGGAGTSTVGADH